MTHLVNAGTHKDQNNDTLSNAGTQKDLEQ